MRDAPPPPTSTKKPPARRFAPVPIETTFESNRAQGSSYGPTAELTPDPSPTTPQLPPILANNQDDQQGQGSQQKQVEKTEKKPRRKFAPQLIETSKRARKSGQEGPATRPTDKTDITPGTNHIYAPKPKRKQGGNASTTGPRPSTSGGMVVADDEDDDASASPRFLTPRRQQSMKPHPNTRRGTQRSFTPDLDTILSSESGSSSGDDDDIPSKPSPMSLGVPALPDSRTPEGDLWNGMRHELRERRESCDEEFSGYLLAVAAKEAHRQRQIEQVMSAFPNGLPPAGVEHFIGRDNSEDEEEPVEDPLKHGGPQLARRKSTDPGWAVKEMRAHADKLADRRTHKISIDMDIDQNDVSPPENPLWTTDGAHRRGSRASYFRDSAVGSPVLRARADSGSPARGKGPDKGASPFGLPFGFRAERDDEDVLLRKMRQAASPPMLGNDLVFRKCVSPQATRMEPTHPYSENLDDKRDLTGNTGLWGGYCSAQSGKKKITGLWQGYCTAKANDKVTSMLYPPAFLATPAEPSTPGDLSTGSTYTPQQGEVASTPTRQPSGQQGQQKGGLHLLSASLDERLRKEKARKELEERIHREFNDAFVTQVYNYISLGYPATARDFDDELSKISGIEMEQLRKDDHLSVGKGFMLEMELPVKSRRRGGASTGASKSSTVDGSGSGSGSGDDDDHVMLSPEEDERRHRNKPPRWRALKLYIREWARQHPSFEEGFGEEDNPLAWGVRARRGSWAI